MLYVFYGTDEIKTRDKANALVQGLQAKHGEAELVRITQESYQGTSLEGLLATQGLFKSNYIIYLDNLGDVYKEWGVQEYGRMHNSEHVCILLAGKLGVATLRDLESNTSKVVEYKAQKVAEKFNIFGIANALKNKDKKRLWAELTKARLRGVEAEGVAGLLFWAVKDMLLKGAHNKWQQQELKELASQLSESPHKARRGGVSLFDSLEHILLKI